VFAQATHVVTAPHGFACLVIPMHGIVIGYISSFIEIRFGVSEPGGRNLVIPLLWISAFTTACRPTTRYWKSHVDLKLFDEKKHMGGFPVNCLNLHRNHYYSVLLLLTTTCAATAIFYFCCFLLFLIIYGCGLPTCGEMLGSTLILREMSRRMRCDGETGWSRRHAHVRSCDVNCQRVRGVSTA